MATIDQKEAKALADILALVVDENANVAEAALAKLRQRAKRDKVTGGALKNIFNAVAGGQGLPPRPPPRRPAARTATGNAERDLDSAREMIGELTVKTMQLAHELSAARAHAAELTANMVAVRSAQAEALLALKRQGNNRLWAWMGGAATGGVLAALLATVAVQSFPGAPAALHASAVAAPKFTGSQNPVALTMAGLQIGPAATNMNWSNTTADGTRWRVLPSGVASGYSLVIDIGGGQTATVGAPASFMQTNEAARNHSIEALRAELPRPAASTP
jgi:hypothetical protein